MKLYGLIGYPLGHSFSKAYFTEKFRKEGLTDCCFEAFPIPSIAGFKPLLHNNPSLKGLSVTIPYKEQVLQFVDELSEEVQFIGATNSIRISEGRLKAYNTDIMGFEQSFSKELKNYHSKALVLGTGGASKAVQFVLKRMGISFLVVSRARNDKAGFIAYEDISQQLITDYTIIVNCTPAGMTPNEHTAPGIPYQWLTSNHYLYDLVYKPSRTLFIEKGALAGATVQNGYEMLLIQAEESWKIWNTV